MVTKIGPTGKFFQAGRYSATGEAMEHVDGLIGAYLLDGKGGAAPRDWQGVRRWQPADGPLWIHLQATDPGARAWLTGESGLPALAAQALLEPETRPRCTQIDGGLVVHLRGVNLDPGAEPDDMVSIRLWVEPDRIVSALLRRLMAVEDVQAALAEKRGPKTAPGLLVGVADRLVARMAPTVDSLGEAIDAVEDESLDSAADDGLEQRLAGLRRQVVGLRRFIAPQREALLALAASEAGWLKPSQRARLKETTNQAIRYVETLEAIRDRAAVAQDELQVRLANRTNRHIYMLTVLAAITMPLTLVAGLLGMNVAGIPGNESPWAFAAVCAGLTALGALELWLLKRIRWI